MMIIKSEWIIILFSHCIVLNGWWMGCIYLRRWWLWRNWWLLLFVCVFCVYSDYYVHDDVIIVKKKSEWFDYISFHFLCLMVYIAISLMNSSIILCICLHNKVLLPIVCICTCCFVKWMSIVVVVSKWLWYSILCVSFLLSFVYTILLITIYVYVCDCSRMWMLINWLLFSCIVTFLC